VLGADRTRRLFPLLLLVLPAKLLVAGRTVTWSEFAGAVLACICWYFLSGYPKQPGGCGRPDRVAADRARARSVSLEPCRKSIFLGAVRWVSSSSLGFRPADPSSEMLLVWIGGLAAARCRLAPCSRGYCRGGVTGRNRGESAQQLVVDEGSRLRRGVALIGWRKMIARSPGRASARS
jgi:hypothetical protein